MHVITNLQLQYRGIRYPFKVCVQLRYSNHFVGSFLYVESKKKKKIYIYIYAYKNNICTSIIYYCYHSYCMFDWSQKCNLSVGNFSISRRYYRVDVYREEIAAIRRCTLKEACQGHRDRVRAEKASRSSTVRWLYSDPLRSSPAKCLPYGGKSPSSFSARSEGNESCHCCEHSQCNQDKDVAKEARRRRTVDLTKLGHTVVAIDMSVVSSSFNSVFRIDNRG